MLQHLIIKNRAAQPAAPLYRRLSYSNEETYHAIQKGKTIRKRQQGSGNVLSGIISALLGSLLGVAGWILIYQAGYISAVGGFMIIFFAMKGYELFGGRLNTLGIVINCIICRNP